MALYYAAVRNTAAKLDALAYTRRTIRSKTVRFLKLCHGTTKTTVNSIERRSTVSSRFACFLCYRSRTFFSSKFNYSISVLTSCQRLQHWRLVWRVISRMNAWLTLNCGRFYIRVLLRVLSAAVAATTTTTEQIKRVSRPLLVSVLSYSCMPSIVIDCVGW